MPTPSPEIIQVLQTFAPAFTAATFANASVLLYGTILALGARTVTAALRAVGRAHERHFTTYHRVLNRARWSPLRLSKLLLGLLVLTFLPPGAPLVLLVDETLERRRGRRIAYKGYFRDPVRSTAGKAVTSAGIRWLCLALLVPLPWSSRPWALPFLTVPALAPATSAKLGKRHRTVVERTQLLVRLVRRWQPERELVLVGDGSYAAVSLGQTCRGLPGTVRLVSRLPWYGGQDKLLDLTTGTALWHRAGEPPLPIRWVLLRCPQRSIPPTALFCTDQAVCPRQVVAWFVGRWNLEVTFEEARAHLGLETQRQWSTRALGRTTPCLLGLFSLVVLLAHALHPQALPTRQTAWYAKPEATFVDALAAVHRHLWQRRNWAGSDDDAHLMLIPRPLWECVHEAVCYAA